MSEDRIHHLGKPHVLADDEEVMTFDVQYNEIILANAGISDGSGSAYNIGSIRLSLDNDMQLSEFEFELEFSPSFVEITGANPIDRVSYDSLIINGNHLQLLNPVIEAGSGEFLELQLFNNVGVGTDISVKYKMALAYTHDDKEVGITFSNEANYIINSVDQYYTIQPNNGAINGGASYQVTSINTVPISLSVIKFENTPNIITPSDEPFEDENGNSIYDIGEPYTDWNQNEEWTPMIESSLPDDWAFDVNFNGSVLTVGVSNWNEPTLIGANPLFTVNCFVNEEAQFNDQVTVATDVVLQLDKWGNSGVPFINGSGEIIINEILSNDINSHLSSQFSLKTIYPNPFNNSTLISFELNEIGKKSLKISIFDLIL